MDIHLNRMRSSRLEDHEQEIKLATGKVKAIHISERGLTSTSWSEYSEEAVKRVQYSSSPTSSITAETVTVDGVTLSQKDTAGVVTTATRSYTASGMLLTQTDGRGSIYNTTELCSKN